jgi:hypothetical protein
MLAAEHARLSAALMEMEKKMAATRAGAASQTLAEQMAAHRQALAALEREQEAERAAEAQRRAAEAAKARRAALTGHSAELANQHAAMLDALTEAEAHAAAMVAAINRAIGREAGTRSAAGAMAAELNVVTSQLSFGEAEFIRRLTSGLCAQLALIRVCRMRRLGPLTLPDDPRGRTGETWAEREANATSSSVEALLEHAEEVAQ